MLHQQFKCFLLGFLLVSTIPACGQATKNTRSAALRVQHEIISVTVSQQSALVLDSILLTGFFKKYVYTQPYEQDIRQFYRKRMYSYAWFEKTGLIEQASILTNRLHNLEGEGVYQRFEHQHTLDSLLDIQKVKSVAKTPDADLELLLTSSYFMYSRLVWGGMNPWVSKSVDWFIPRKELPYEQYLDSILKAPLGTRLPDEPVYRQYELLKAHLEKYRRLQSSDAWQPLTAKKQATAGDSSAFIQKVKSRLFKLGDLTGDTSEYLYDQNLTHAIKRFQERNGLSINGILNQPTLAELNIPLKTKIQQILVNMERSRWLPLAVAGDHAAVNIPEFKLHVYHADSLLWSCDAVVGKTVHPTAQFYGEIKYVVFSPYWNVPPGILRQEILPAIKKNPGYLAAHDMEITGYQQGLPIVRQRPGRSNPLGLVKFLFPNSYNIYLHDTPSKTLFKESSRAFSHGCIRISEPEKFAAFLLREMASWSSDRIKSAMLAGRERYVTLDEPVPVFIAYFTAFVDRSNRLNFRKDIYDLDDRLFSMILTGKGY